MKCSKCNQMCPPNAVFCVHCGNALTVDSLEEIEVLDSTVNSAVNKEESLGPKPIPVQDNHVYSQPQPIMAPPNLFPKNNVPVNTPKNNFFRKKAFTRHRLKFSIKDITHNKALNRLIFLLLVVGIGYLIYFYYFSSEVTCTKTEALEESVYVAKFDLSGLTYLSSKTTYDYSLYNYYDVLEFQDFLSSDIETFTYNKENENYIVSYEIDDYFLSLIYETSEDTIKDTESYQFYSSKEDFVEFMENDGYTCE